MRNLYNLTLKKVRLFISIVLVSAGSISSAAAQNATASLPVALGSPCNVSFSSTSNDSVKLFNYNAATNTLTHNSRCQPILAAPNFRDDLTGITYNPFDGNYYLQRIALASGIYNTYIFRWNPTTCPGPAPLSPYATFLNQFVVGLEFDPATGLAYQLNFIDTTGVPSSVVDATNNVGQYSSGVVLSTGVPAMAYFDATNNDLKYARAKDPDGTDWYPAITVTSPTAIGNYVSIAIVNGNPAITYYDNTGGNLMYVRATDAAGTAWAAPVTVEAANNVGQFTSLAVVNGNPAISFYDITNGDLRYIRATDANGTAWGAGVAVATAGNVGQYSSLKVVNGNPAIAYYSVTGSDIIYVRATDVNGAAWGAPVTVEASAGNVGGWASMEVVNGNPAISYFDASNNDLRYARATDANGTAWGAAVAVATAGTVGSFTSLKVVNGNPAISYFDIGNNDLKYVRAADASGTAWGTPVTPEATNAIGQYTSLFIVNGNPAIAFFDVTGANAKYIRAYDNVGSLWYNNSKVYNMHLQRINFTTGLIEESKRVNFGGRYIYSQNGDLVLTPDGKYLGIYDNKYFNINWKDYNSGALVATYIDTMVLPVTAPLSYIVGLAYSDGKLVASTSTPSRCTNSYKEIDIITGTQTNITYAAGPTFFTAADMTNIPTGIGAAKRLVSSAAVGGGTYDLVYEIVVRNYGGNPVTNVQVYDTLSDINGAGNVVSRSISSFTAPAGFTQNPLYTGTTAGFMNLLVPGGTLSNIPGQNEIKIQITVRVANILPGIIYNNQATVTATNLFGTALRDLSTNGDNPDMNNNAKPDDIGEAQPTPFLVQLAGSTSPCLTLTKVLFAQDFGTGATATGLYNAVPAPVLGTGVSLPLQQTAYAPVTTQPLNIDEFTLTADALNANTTKFINLQDHTPADVNGQMMVVNADVTSRAIYRGGFTFPLCSNQQYSLSFYSAFIGNAAYGTICGALNSSGQFIYPKLLVRIRDGATLSIITEVSTGNITSTSWQQYGVKFTSPASYTSIIFEIINEADGGCGNDLALDDIQFGSCDPTPVVGVSTITGCLGNTSTLSGSLSDPGAISGPVQYQWQVATSSSGPFTDLTDGGSISGATTTNLVINPLAAADTGKYYRLLVSAMGNIANPDCRFNSPATLLSGKAPSLAPSSVSKSKSSLCPGVSVDLTQVGGTLGTNAVWRWYTGGCNATLVGTGASISVAPTVTTTYYVLAAGDCNTTVCVPVTVTVSCDVDKDNDGIPDYVESNIAAAFADANGNGVVNAYDPTYGGFVDTNGDFINDNFQADGDSDNDGTLNYLDTDFTGRVDTNSDGVDDRFDTDRDGIINMLDLDSDNDGITDVAEAFGVDANGDGRIDNLTDTDGDGLSDNVDSRIVPANGAYNTGTGLGLTNFDGDAVPNFLDLDSDNDGIPDVVEVQGTDANNNGMIDGFVDANSDGLHDSYINASALLITGTDVTSDGRADSWPNKNLDNDLRPNAYDLDSDGDGIVDAIEAGSVITDTDLNGLADGALGANGWSTTVSAAATLPLRNTETVGNPDYLDIDSDGDGIPDNIEGMSTPSYQLPTTTDADGDGLMSPYDNIGGFGGSGIFVYDNDGDGIPDYRDLDTDGDGSLDLCEGNDWNLNGICDEPLILTGLDSDGDGLDNLFDSLISVTNIKGTSYMMGNGGSFTGDATPGTRATVQRTTVAQGDRDWRWAATVLPVQFLGFTAVLQNTQVNLSWSVITAKEIDRFEVERSTDNTTFNKTGTVTDAVQLNIQQNLGFIDDIAGVNSDVIFYRLKVYGKNGEVKYSNVLVVKRSQFKTPVTVMPNPAQDVATVRFFVEKESEVTIRLVDNIGKTVLQQKQRAAKGNNAVLLNGLAKFSNGVYSVQVWVNGEPVTQKLIISH